MGLNGLGRCLAVGALLAGFLYSPPETKAGVVMTSVTDRDVYTPGSSMNLNIRLDSTNYPGSVAATQYFLTFPIPLESPSSVVSIPNYFDDLFFQSVGFRKLSGLVAPDAGPTGREGPLTDNSFIVPLNATPGEYSFDLDRSLSGVEGIASVYDLDANLLPLIVQNNEIVITYPGDANLNYQVTIGDVTILAENFGRFGGWEQGDFTGDGLVSIGDLTILAENFGAGNYSSLSSSVPAPSTFVAGLTLLGLAGLSGRGRGKKQGLIGRIYQSGLRDSGLGVGIIGANH